jgi:hypothetical protein
VISAFAKQLFNGAQVSFERDGDPRRRLNVRIKTPAVIDLRSALSNLQHS